MFPVIRNFLEPKNVIWLFVFSLASLFYNYVLVGIQICFANIEFYTCYNISTCFTNIVDFNVSFSVTPLSYLFSLLVISIGCATNIYILNYFKGEADESGFIFWINSFVLSMLILVLSNNFFTLFLGWELIGLTSFFLINFWQSKRSTLKSSFKAFSFNLVSDLFLLGSLVIFYYITGTSDIPTFLYLINWGGLNDPYLLNFSLLLLIGCASIKSVQIFGHLWLPDSMEAPVPASALIHSATLVSAGIYVLERFNSLLVLNGWLVIISIVGSITALYGGVVAASQTDMKKLLAYSTMSHCGFLMVLVSFLNFHILIIYLFLHGLFKAATFFCSGSFIRIYGSQDTRMMGGSQRLFFSDSLLLLICAGNLCGLPFSIGVLYKTYFLTALLYNSVPFYVTGCILVGMLSGNIYFFRLVYYSLFDIIKWVKLGLYTSVEVSIIRNHRFFDLYYTVRNHFIAVSTLIMFSFFMFFVFLWVTTYNVVELIMPTLNSYLPSYIYSVTVNLYGIYFIYFYFIYFIIILLLLLINWRKQYNWGIKFYSIFILLTVIMISNVLFMYVI